MLYKYKAKSIKKLSNLTFIDDIYYSKNTSANKKHILNHVTRYVPKDFDYFDEALGREKLYYECFKFINYIEFDINKYIGMELIFKIANNKLWKYSDK